MSDARQNILQRIRQANQQRLPADASGIIERRFQKHRRGPCPTWREDLLTRFAQKAQQAAASYESVKSKEDIMNAVVRYLSEQALAPHIVCAGTAKLNELVWPETLKLETRAGTVDDSVVLVEAFAGIAETGSIVMRSGKETPVSLNFLPDHFLCVVRVSSIVNTVEDVWQRLRGEDKPLPRAINLITGPSRTADVEQIIQMGAHGPRRVHLLLLDPG
ncbi:MAG: LUD domain-containing protein [Gammaproteobacteria bacterium]|jgi:L-lactate dehydrogenase complex protein LldG